MSVISWNTDIYVINIYPPQISCVRQLIKPNIINNLIRPGTIAVRMSANIIAGHLPLTLLGKNGPSTRHTLLTLLITAQIPLLILEAAVAIIQSYVFAILRTLYSREVN